MAEANEDAGKIVSVFGNAMAFVTNEVLYLRASKRLDLILFPDLIEFGHIFLNRFYYPREGEPMKHLHCVGVIFGVFLMVSLAGAEDCLKEGEGVTFTGKISRETFPGPPNYTSIDDGDKPETYWILTISSPRCVVAESMEDSSLYELAKSTTRFQLAFEDYSIYTLQKSLVENSATVTGTIFSGHSGHHHTKALISVKSIK